MKNEISIVSEPASPSRIKTAWQIVLPLSIMIFLFYACQKDVEKSTFSLSGTVLHRGKPADGVSVSIDEKIDLSAQTDIAGNFTITGIPKGEHQIKLQKIFVSTGADAGARAFSQKTLNVSVVQDIARQELTLPGSTLLIEPPEVTESTAKMKWRSSDDVSFREYRVYRLPSSGVSETTGTLIDATFSRVDTTFLDTKLSSQSKYYYRVYTFSESATLNGSNIIAATTVIPVIPPPPPITLFKNGSFEDTGPGNSIVDWFTPSGITSDNTVASEGMRSIKFALASPGSGCYPLVLQQQIFYSNLVPNAIYKIGFKYKSDFNLSAGSTSVGLSDFLMCTGCTGPGGLTTRSLAFSNTAGWQTFTADIQAPPVDKIYYVTVDFCLFGVTGNIWIDELTLVKY